MQNGNLSYWMSRNDVTAPPTSSVTEDDEVDIAIIGGGLTGLWTAWAIAEQSPELSVAVFEAGPIGFGASGRNGGWLSAKPVGIRTVLADEPSGTPGVLQTERLLASMISEIVDILGADQIDAVHGGWLEVSRSPSEQARVEAYLQKSRKWGLDENRLMLLSKSEVEDRVKVSGALGGLFSPDCYRVDPAKMLFALAALDQKLGIKLFTNSRVTKIKSNRIEVNDRTIVVRGTVVVATEGYTSQQPGQHRRMLPMNSAMIVTDPLSSDMWDKIGWSGSECLGGSAHTFFYAQRTQDGRIAIGGRGRPYRFGSGFDHDGEVDQETADSLAAVLADIFPQVSIGSAHSWCGVLGVSRDWSPFVDYDRDAQILRVGGYAGQGLAGAHLAGRITADLLANRDTSLTALPWVRPRPRQWEPEPLRWIGANGLYGAYSLADKLEAKSKNSQTSRLAVLAGLIAGR